MTENEIAKQVVNVAFKIHTMYGPGLLESVYEEIMYYELKKIFVNVRRQQLLPIIHEELYIPNAFRADLIVNSKVIIEVKSIEAISPVLLK